MVALHDDFAISPIRKMNPRAVRQHVGVARRREVERGAHPLAIDLYHEPRAASMSLRRAIQTASSAMRARESQVAATGQCWPPPGSACARTPGVDPLVRVFHAASTSLPQLYPGRKVTPGPGWQEAPHKKR